MTRITVDGREVLIQKIDERWKLSTPIFEGRGEFPPETHECLKLVQQLKWESAGVLEMDTTLGTVHWTQEVHPSNFGKDFPRFLKHAQEWEEILVQGLFHSGKTTA